MTSSSFSSPPLPLDISASSFFSCRDIVVGSRFFVKPCLLYSSVGATVVGRGGKLKVNRSLFVIVVAWLFYGLNWSLLLILLDSSSTWNTVLSISLASLPVS
jgi:hypothetical protein